MAEKERNPGREEFLARAAELYDEMVSRAGPDSGDTFDDIEQQAEGAGRKLILNLLRERLAFEEEVQAQTILCPKCKRLMRRPENAMPRNLDTASGMVHYERRHAICDRCGASFSPSGPAPEDSHARSVEPPETQGL